MLLAEAERSQVVAVGSRSIGSVAGFFLGSVGVELAARAACPVALARAQGADIRRGDVVVGVHLRGAYDEVLEFAFEAATWRRAALRVMYAGKVPAIRDVAPWAVDVGLSDAREEAERTLGDVLARWRDDFPGVRVFEETVSDSPSRRRWAPRQGRR